MARVGWIGSAAVVLFGVAAAAIAAPSSVPASATPTTATVGVATPVVVSSLITDTTFISANLLRTDATGRSLSIVGTLHDDGLNGDAVAGDRVFSYSVSVTQAATGKVHYRVSAAFRGVLARVLSNVVAIDILPLKTTPQITLTLTPSPVNGWSRSTVTAHYTCTPQGSAIVSCPQDQVFSSDGANLVATGSVTDATGGTATATSQPFGVDQSVPGITVSLTPNLAPGSWTNQSVTAHFTCADGLSGVASCPPDQTLSTEGANQVITGTAVDTAGNSASVQTTASIDRTTPTASVALSPAPDANGIFRSAVTAHFSCADALSGVASCPPDQLFSAVGAGLVASGVVTDAAGNSANLSSNPFNIQFAAPTITVTLSPAANANGWNNGPVTAHFVCDENGQPLAGCPADIVTATEGANLTVSGSVTDASGVSASVTSALFNIDLTPPVLTLAAPNGASAVFVSPVNLTGSAMDALAGVDTVTCANAPASLLAASVACTVALTQGPNSIDAVATDRAGNTTTLSLPLQYTRVPQVTITSPLPSSYLNITPTTVAGTVDDASATVVVNGLTAPVSNGQFSMILPLAEGPNTVAATATSNGGAAGTASIQVTLDTTPPHISINSPPDQFETTDGVINISGIINDIVVGTVNTDQARVSVNGTSAQVANRTFLKTDVPLQLGVNTIQAVGTDRVGNFATTSVTVTRLPAAGLAKIALVSGNNQTAPIRAPLSAPLVVAVTDAAGAPAANQQVIFKVTQNDGTITGGGTPAVTVLATTDTQGHASVQWTLGGRAGAGGNTVEAYSVGFDGTAIFSATGTLGTPGKIVVDTGNNQLGPIGQPLPKPFIAVVVDDGNNRLGNIPVTFRVADGGGTINGNDFETVITDSDGRAAVTLTLGTQEGEANNLVSADFAGNQGFPAAFTASGRYPGDPAQTTISGVVLDNTNAPIPGVTVRAVLTNVMTSNGNATQTAPTTQTDAQGQFSIAPAPVGLVKLLVDGGTASVPGPYPSLEYDTVTVAGSINTVGQPIFLVPLNTANSLCVTDSTGGGTLTIPEAPGFSLTFGPGQVTFPGGSKSGCVSVTVVNREKVPMAPGFGQQPRFIVTIQPSGALFNPPAPITLPNVDGLKPRAVTEMYSFDHDISAFVAIGTGIVSDDGSVIRSAAGVGVMKAGWHCGGDPNAIGTTANCASCQYCAGIVAPGSPSGTQPGACVPDPNQIGQSCGGAFNNCWSGGSCGVDYSGGYARPTGQCDGGIPFPDGTACNTGGNSLGTCQGGNCIGTGNQCPVSCDDNDPCTTDYCSGGNCSHRRLAQCGSCVGQPDGTACNSGGAVQGQCVSNQCKGQGNQCPAVCADGSPWTTDSCTDGTCSFQPDPTGESCGGVADGTSCGSNGGTCQAGVCSTTSCSFNITLEGTANSNAAAIFATQALAAPPTGLSCSTLLTVLPGSNLLGLGLCAGGNCPQPASLGWDFTLTGATATAQGGQAVINVPTGASGRLGTVSVRGTIQGQVNKLIDTKIVEVAAGSIIVRARNKRTPADGQGQWLAEEGIPAGGNFGHLDTVDITVGTIKCLKPPCAGTKERVRATFIERTTGRSFDATPCEVDFPSDTGVATCSLVFDFSSDTTPPSLTYSLNPAPQFYDSTGEPWFNGSTLPGSSLVTAMFSCSDLDGSGHPAAVRTCPANTSYGPFPSDGRYAPMSPVAIDSAGNTNAVPVSINVDRMPPLIVPSLYAAPNSIGIVATPTNGWFNQPVELRFDVSDAQGSGVNATLTRMEIDGVPVASVSGWTFTSDGRHFGQLSASDYAANRSTGGQIVNVDLTPPAIAIINPASGSAVVGSSVSVTLGVVDSLSGVDAGNVKCALEASPTRILFNATAGGGGLFTCSVPMLSGSNQIYAIATDLAGNLGTSQTITVNGGLVP